MKVVSAMFFWLGPLDTRVATGRENAGGTRDIRFCRRGDVVREFLDQEPSAKGFWDLQLAAHSAARIPKFRLRMAEYEGVRGPECALPQQYAGSNSAYPLWARSVRLVGNKKPPLDAIAFLRDDKGQIHARVVPREKVPTFPKSLRLELEQWDQCARFFSGPPCIVDDTCFARPTLQTGQIAPSDDKLLSTLQGLTGPGGTKETKTRRHNRSRKLAETLKDLYNHRCQLCEESALRIKMSKGQWYVEVHHIQGLAEADTGGSDSAVTQLDAGLSLDHFRNVIVVCPYHHAMLHHDYRKFRWDEESTRFLGHDGTVLPLLLNKHL